MIRVKGEPIERKPLIKKAVTIDGSNVTKRAKPAGSGRKRVHASGADRQKAYRERRRAAGEP